MANHQRDPGLEIAIAESGGVRALARLVGPASIAFRSTVAATPSSTASSSRPTSRGVTLVIVVKLHQAILPGGCPLRTRTQHSASSGCQRDACPLYDAALHGSRAGTADHPQPSDLDKNPVIGLYGVKMGRLMVVVIKSRS